MIEKMTKYAFLLPSGEKEHFLEELRDLGVIDITRSTKPVDERSSALLSRAEALTRTLNSLENLKIDGKARGVAPEGLPDTPSERAEALLGLREEILVRREAAWKETEERRVWGEFDASALTRLAEHGLHLHFYRVPRKKFDASWAAQWPLELIGETAGECAFVIVSESPDCDFPFPECPAPKGSWKESAAESEDLEQRIAGIDREIKALQDRKEEIAAERDAVLREMDFHLASCSAESAAEDHITVLTGFAPRRDDEMLEKAVARMDAYCIREAATVEDAPPISLKNNAFVRMFEPLTDMYGRPSYNGFDPTPFIAVFFMLFFAFCMGDAGYGLVMILAGLGMKKSKGFRDMAPLVVTLGVATTVIGFLFHTFFSIDIAGWKVFSGIQGIFLPAKLLGYDGAMILSLVVGVLHICLALVVKTVNETRNKGFLGALGTWGWMLLIVGGVAVAAFFFAGVLDRELTKWIVIGLGSLSALGIFLLNDLHRNPLLNIGSGLWETYNTATGLLGDVLSYLRLYALGLAGAMLGKAFNDIGLQVLGDGSSIGAWVPFILIVLVGHTLNIAMAALGAFVHPLRLNFLEFFKNSGYEGDGRSYNPLKK